MHQLEHATLFERTAARDHHEQHAADGVEVRAMIDRGATVRLFGRTKARGTEQRAFLRWEARGLHRLVRGQDLRHAKIEQLDHPTFDPARVGGFMKKDVLALDVAMNDALCVRRFQRREHVRRDLRPGSRSAA